jgi:hypothetical protein
MTGKIKGSFFRGMGRRQLEKKKKKKGEEKEKKERGRKGGKRKGYSS